MSAADDAEIEQKVTDLDATSEAASAPPQTAQDVPPQSSLAKTDPSQGRPTSKSSRVTWPEGEPEAGKKPPPTEYDALPPTNDRPLLCRLYNDPYRWELVTGTIMFFLALEMTRELWGVAIPLRVYQPFWRIIEMYKCVAKTWNK